MTESTMNGSNPLDHYKSRKLQVLTPEEQAIYINEERQIITIDILKADHEFIKANGLNMQRIVLFLVHEWLAKKKQEWGME